MNVPEWLNQARDIHLAALASVLREQRQQDPHAVSEVLIELNSKAYRGIYRLRRPDILYRDDEGQVRCIKVDEDHYLSFDAFASEVSGASIHCSPFHWSNFQVTVEGEFTDWSAFEQWAHDWIDIEDARLVKGQEWDNVIHDVSEPTLQEGLWTFAMDLGSAPVDCIDQLLALLIDMGARSITLGSSASV